MTESVRMSDTASVNYLDPQTLAAIGPIDLRARMIVEGLMAGMHRSPYQGFSVEFAQHRQYAPGDDLRFLDWKVYGRTDKLYLKQYQKETNLDLLIMVDASGSMGYSSEVRRGRPGWRKYDHAASVAAALAYLALRQRDRVAVVLFADELHSETSMSGTRDHWRTIVETLSSETFDEAPYPTSRRHKPQGTRAQGQPPTPRVNSSQSTNHRLQSRGTDLGKLFDQVAARLRQRSLLVLLSDLFDSPEALERGLARFHHHRHDVMVLQTLDHAELEFPFRTPSDFFGLEDEGRVGLDPAAIRQAYLDALNRHLRRVEQLTRRFRFDYLLLDSSQPLSPPLSHFLARRAAMIKMRK